MARNRSSTFEDFVEIVARLPWWVGTLLALVFYVWLHNVASQPTAPGPTDIKQLGNFASHQLWITLAMFLQYIVPVACLLGAGISAYKHRSKGSGNNTLTVKSNSIRENSETDSHVKSSNTTCPSCGAPMAKRIAKKGANAGEAFWGCSKFPQCRGTRTIG